MEKKGNKIILKDIGIIILNLILSGIISLIFSLAKINNKTLNSIPIFISSLILTFIFGKKLYLSFKKDNLKKAFLGLIWGAIFAAVFIGLFIITSQGKLNFTINNAGLNISTALTALNLLLYAAAEEIFLRGFVFNDLKNKFSLKTTVVLVSMFNIFFSLSPSTDTPILALNKFLFSILLTLFVCRLSSIEYTIIFKYVFIIVITFGLRSRGIDLINGGDYGVMSGLLFTAVIVLCLFVYAKKERIQLNPNKILTIVTSILLVFAIGYSIFNYIIWHTDAVQDTSSIVKHVTSNDNINNYNMEWKLDTVQKKINGIEEVSYINTSKDNLSEVYFHAYAAAFKKYNGNIKIQEIDVNDIKSDFNIEGSDLTLVKVPLNDALKPNQRVDIKMKYLIDIPERSGNGFADRFAYDKDTINLGNCFPIAAVYEDGKWDKHLYDQKGDAFYSECSNFKVKITAPKEYIMAVTGDINKEENSGRSKIWTITSENVRDFAAVASDKFQIVKANIGGTVIKSYAFDKTKAEKVLSYSAKAIETFNKRYGEYPYSTCSVVQTDLQGGMEYPTMVMIISDSYTNITAKNIMSVLMYQGVIGDLEDVVVHELAHQWWYGLVGDNEYDEAWVD
ncbi:MAG: hypothetical protein Q8900_03115, partial [Bacillota bacterium]|nr:hypothetical protein [Bacillota bacterium]